MKKLFFTLGIAASALMSAQIYTQAGGTISGTGGNVGIGTSTPTSKLTVDGDILGSKRLSFQDDARFNVSTSHVPTLASSVSPFSMPHYGIATPNTSTSAELWISGHNGIRMFSAGFVKPRMSINSDGKVLIGDYDSNNFGFPSCSDCNDYKLFVKDGIRTEQVKVDIAASNGWADYVFKKDYKLRSLAEIEKFISENGHLPEVPSEKEAIENGVELKAMNILLLKKIEELTLYTIDQQKEIDNLKSENHTMKGLAERLNALEKQINVSK